MAVLLLWIVFICSCHGQGDKIPTVTLYNAAVPNTLMPVVGLGTGGYSHARSSQATPEVRDLLLYVSTVLTVDKYTYLALECK